MNKEDYIELFTKRAKGELPAMFCTQNLVKLLKPIFRPGMTVLDVGCGVGHYYAALKQLQEDISYIGLDNDSAMIHQAREIWGSVPHFLLGEATQLAAGLIEPFDIVICYNMLLHCENWKEVIQALLRATGKYLIIRTLIMSDDVADIIYPTTEFIDGALYQHLQRIDIMSQLKGYKVEIHDDEVPGEYETPQNYEVILIERR